MNRFYFSEVRFNESSFLMEAGGFIPQYYFPEDIKTYMIHGNYQQE